MYIACFDSNCLSFTIVYSLICCCCCHSFVLTSCRPGYESVPSRMPVHSSSSTISFPSHHLSRSTSFPNAINGDGTSSSSSSILTPPIPGRRAPRLLRNQSTRGATTQEQLTSIPSNSMSSMSVRGNGVSSQPTRSSPIQNIAAMEGGRSGVSVSILPVHGGRVGSGRGGVGTTVPLTRQDLYRSRNFLHQDLQLPDGYGEHVLKYSATIVFFCLGMCHNINAASSVLLFSTTRR